MMESSNQSQEVREELIEEEDPLLELARIVSGEDLEKTNQHSGQYGRATAVAPSAEPMPGHAGGGAAVMSAAEAEEFTQGLEGSLEEMLADSMTTESVTAEFEESLAELGYEASGAGDQLAGHSEPAVESGYEQHVAEQESSFTDALEEELNAGLEETVFEPEAVAPDEAPVSEPAVEPEFYSAPVDRAAVAEAMAEPSFDATDAVAGTFEPELSPEFVAGEFEATDFEHQETIPQPTETVAAAQNEDDLGDIFAAEFEQITAEHTAAQVSAESALEAALLQDDIGSDTGELSFLNNRSLGSDGYADDPGMENIGDVDEDLEAEFGAAFEESEAVHAQINLSGIPLRFRGREVAGAVKHQGHPEDPRASATPEKIMLGRINMTNSEHQAPAMVRLGAVSYLNSRPLIEDLEHLLAESSIQLDYPSRLADALAIHDLDVALIPSIEYFRRPGYEIISDACVAARGEVMSVKLYCRVHPGNVRRMALDEGSRTSATLSKIILAERYGAFPESEPLSMESMTGDSTADAVLLIGDRAMHAPQESFVEVMDLGQMWYDWTGLPFVFAMWVAHADADMTGVAAALNEARDRGISAIANIAAAEAPKLNISRTTALKYLTQNLHYKMTSAERSGLQLFHELASRHNLVDQNANLVFSDFVTA